MILSNELFDIPAKCFSSIISRVFLYRDKSDGLLVVTFNYVERNEFKYAVTSQRFNDKLTLKMC